MKLYLALLWAAAVIVLAERKSYKGYNIWEVTVDNAQQADLLQRMEDAGHLDILKLSRPDKVAYVWMNSDGLDNSFSAVRGSGMRLRIYEKGVPEKIESEYKRLDERYGKDKYAFDLNDFNTYDAVIAQIPKWVAACPSGLTCKDYSIGKSYEGRDMRVINIKKTGSNNRVIFFEHTIHAREWLSPTTVQNVVNHVIKDYGTDTEVQKLVNNFDLYFLLIANPDGYVETWTGDRMWRKSVKPNPGSQCAGTDINRNFDSHWSKQGASFNPCTDTYVGASAASEMETQNIAAEAKRITASGKKILSWFAVHCCAEMWMFPYGYTKDYLPWTSCVKTKDHNDLMTVGKAAVSAMGKSWAVGTICDVIYPATGDTGNYMYDEAGVKYTFAIELAGKFIDDKSKIPSVYQDFWKGLMGSVNKMLEIDG